MTAIAHPSTRADHKAALAACRECPACIQELVTLRDQWDAQSRAIAELQRALADANDTREAVRQSVPAP